MDYLLFRLNDLPAGDMTLLDEEEQSRAVQQGDTFLRIRCALKRELARRCGCAPADVRFRSGEHGKPLFEPQPFNISHSRGLLCMAFHHRAVGVDIEYCRTRSVERLAPHIMGEEQLAAFRAHGCPQEEFFPCWCAAEALVKQAGDSIWNARRYPFLYEHGRIRPLFEGAPQVELFTPAPGCCGAVAYE